nr:DNA-binding protein WhiA [Lachnospiraceae bacterium]
VKNCCKRAFLKGAFLVSGSVNNPEKSYHFEIVCKTKERAALLQDILNEFDLDAKTASRGNKILVYLKEGDKIADALGYMGADLSMLSMENTRILKEMRGNVNRVVNCETANIAKVVNASLRQVEDIHFIEEHGGLSQLPDSLRLMAEARLEYPDASLIELGEKLNPPVGKSGVNHRLRRISELAEKLGRVRA